jgi:predicted metal-binding membrane protein
VGVLFAAGHRPRSGGWLLQTHEQGTAIRSTASTSDLWRDLGTVVTGAALIVIAGAAWFGVVLQGMGMQPGSTDTEGSVSLSGASTFLGAWGVMMAAMMLPSATPMIALYDKLGRGLSQGGRHVAATAVFASVYLAIWLGFGLVVYIGGAVLNRLADAIPILWAWFPYGLAAVLIAAGAYQFTALKQSCLRYCRTPLSFLMARWESGYAGTLKLAGTHAAYCIGCCGALMVILVAAGAMSLPWVLLIAAIVFVEKLVPRGDFVARLVGAGFVVLGLAVAIDPDLAAMLRGTAMSSM